MACMVSISTYPLLLAEMSPRSLTFLRYAARIVICLQCNSVLVSFVRLCQHTEVWYEEVGTKQEGAASRGACEMIREDYARLKLPDCYLDIFWRQYMTSEGQWTAERGHEITTEQYWSDCCDGFRRG